MTENNLIFCAYSNSYLEDCLKLFDQNCPKYFATNERQDYIAFLQKKAQAIQNWTYSRRDRGCLWAGYRS